MTATPRRQAARGAAGLRLSFHGAAGTVTGSKHLVDADDTKILLDAGLFQGLKELRKLNWKGPAFNPRRIDQVLITHSHIDHVGYLPRLVRNGLRAPVHCTAAAHDLIEIMLLDSAKIQEEDARHANRRGYSKHRPARPLYTTRDARRTLDLRRKHSFRRWIQLADGIRARFLNSGHLLGAGFVELRVRRGSRERTIVYSGDIGRFDVPLHVDPKPLPPCDALIIESTYGNRKHRAIPLADQIGRALRRTLQQGGTVLIPAFAVGRSQQMTLALRRLMKGGLLPEVPIHIDSPMAINATRVYSRFLNRRNVDEDVFEDGRLRLFPENVEFHRTVQDSRRLNGLRGPRIIVSSSGMLTAGRVLHHLRRLAPDPRNLILLAGYQAAGTRGRDLADGADAVRVHGRWVPNRAKVVSLRGLSGHADREELATWVAGAPKPPRVAFVVHGESDSARSFARLLRNRFGITTRIPELGESFDLEELLDD